MPKTINTNLPSVSTGDVLTATAYNNAITSLNSTTVPPMCRARRATTQSFANGALGAVNFDTQDIDTDDMFAPTANFITTATAGVYMFVATVSFGNNTTGQRAVVLVHQPTFSGSGDSATITAGTRIGSQFTNALGSTIQTAMTASSLYSCAANDKIAVLAFQNSGGALSTEITSEQTTISAILVGRTS